MGTELMAVLPDAYYIGFTGTPIDNISKGKGTFKTFGVDDDKGFLDKYSIENPLKMAPLYAYTMPWQRQISWLVKRRWKENSLEVDRKCARYQPDQCHI